jgi:magnesium transporter
VTRRAPSRWRRRADEAAPESAPTESVQTQSESLDEDNRLKSDFIRRVRDALDAGEVDEVYNLVEPLHPADIADLFEMVAADERAALADAISDLMGGEVFAELNDHVREALVEALPAKTSPTLPRTWRRTTPSP